MAEMSCSWRARSHLHPALTSSRLPRRSEYLLVQMGAWATLRHTALGMAPLLPGVRRAMPVAVASSSSRALAASL